MPEIAFIMGKSSSGKDHIYKALIEDEELALKTVTLYTTRPMRNGEVDGVEYYFVDDEATNGYIADGRVIEIREYKTVKGLWRYYTLDDGQINISNGKYIVIGTLEAYIDYCKYFGKEHIMPVYIEVDDGIRLERALIRERKQEVPQYSEMCRRFLADQEDFSDNNIIDAGIEKRSSNNEAIETCIEEIKADILRYMK